MHFNSSLSDPDLLSRSQECEKVKALALIVSQSFQMICVIWYTDVGCWFDESHTHFVLSDYYSRVITLLK